MKAPVPERFHLTQTPLAKGTNLLEASAGTGKTYAIAALFTRLILEKNLAVDEILAVTYTVAATAELRQRIRQTLANTLKAFAGQPSRDNFIHDLVAKLASENTEMMSRLERALSCFDQAAIYTIHGFCQLTLQDRAFESGMLFDVELVTEQSNILQEIAGDYWRNHFYAGAPVPIRFALKNNLRPETLLTLFKDCINHPFLKFQSPVAGKTLEELTRELEQTFGEARDIWQRDRKTIKSFFGSNAKWGNKPYNRDDEMVEIFDQLERCVNASEADYESLKALGWFRTSSIAEKTSKKAKSPAPTHPFFDLCERLAEAEQNFLIGLKLDFVHWAREELPRRKSRQKVQSFDDLLTSLYHALHGPGGDTLAANLRGKYQAALIDEFQDTDPVQYDIFRRVFGGGENFLYLIGDPKQSIYAFRGADIFTYMQAAKAVNRTYTLGENWRSEQKLVQAVNTVFVRPKNPFVFSEIRFEPVIAKAKADKEPLTANSEKESPFQIWFWNRKGSDIPKSEAEEQLPKIVAGEIVRLLDDNTRIGDRPLKPEDIAVLVSENKQAQQMQNALRELNVPSVLHTATSLFSSIEAQEFLRVLMAIAQPSDERLLKAALATELIGFTGARLVQVAEAEMQMILERFHDYSALWTERGFFRMFRRWLQREQVRQRLLTFPDGERRLTNVLHLGEVLHQTEMEFRLGTSGLIKWLGEQMNPELQAADEYQLRLERDDNAVRLVTIHKSKGLQYGVVFCPFGWRHSEVTRGSEEPVFFHDPTDKFQLACDLLSRDYDQHRELAERERLAENVRLMYVAVTRAIHRCCFVWGGFKNAGSSAPAWLFHQPTAIDEPKIEELSAQFADLSDDTMRAQLSELADASEDSVQIHDLPEPTNERYRPSEQSAQVLTCRDFTGKIPRDWFITSFSFLTAGRTEDLPDRDNVPLPAKEAEPGSGIFGFPRGVRAGTCLHEIFQQVDFAGTQKAAEPIIKETLRIHRLFTPSHANAVADMLDKVFHTSLKPKRPDFTFSRVSANERLNELEFHFPVEKIALPKLHKCLVEFGEYALPPLQMDQRAFDVTSGFLKGFIDVVFRFDGRFYIVDWKSNWLGNHAEDYHADALRAEMQRHFYFLQYHLYVAALHKYLALHLPDYDYEKHFGGVFYVFLRGIEPSRPELGIFRDRPSSKLLQQFCKVLEGH